MTAMKAFLYQTALAVVTSAILLSTPESFDLSVSTASLVNLTVSDLWNLYVGPVQTTNITTVVAPTPVPSSELIPPPFIRPPPGLQQQFSTAKTNESWQFPKGFWWGVAGAAYQTEGAVRDEGRGPSIWDVMSHRAPNYIKTNETGDVADNHYYLYKQGLF